MDKKFTPDEQDKQAMERWHKGLLVFSGVAMIVLSVAFTWAIWYTKSSWWVKSFGVIVAIGGILSFRVAIKGNFIK